MNVKAGSSGLADTIEHLCKRDERNKLIAFYTYIFLNLKLLKMNVHRIKFIKQFLKDIFVFEMHGSKYTYIDIFSSLYIVI